jgi:hypothetical protein
VPFYGYVEPPKEKRSKDNYDLLYEHDRVVPKEAEEETKVARPPRRNNVFRRMIRRRIGAPDQRGEESPARFDVEYNQYRWYDTDPKYSRNQYDPSEFKSYWRRTDRGSIPPWVASRYRDYPEYQNSNNS